MKVRKIGVLGCFWGESEIKIGVLWCFWDESEGKRGPEVALG